MSGEKTEQPTPKRLKDARKKGQVAKSQDLTEAVLFLTAVGVLAAGGAAFMSELRAMMVSLFQPRMLSGNLPDDELMRRMGQAWARTLLFSSPLIVALFV